VLCRDRAERARLRGARRQSGARRRSSERARRAARLDRFALHVAGILATETLAKRATLFDQGNGTKVIYFIKTSRVRIARNTSDGKEVTVAILGPGDMFDEEALFGVIEGPTVATCMEKTLTCRAYAGNLFELLAGSSSLALKVARLLSHRLTNAPFVEATVVTQGLQGRKKILAVERDGTLATRGV
jgi:CRP-like cAMP-binding protein